MEPESDNESRRRFGTVEGLDVLFSLGSGYPFLVVCVVYLAFAGAWIELGHPPPWVADDYPNSHGAIVSVLKLLSAFLLTSLGLLACPTSLILLTIAALGRLMNRQRGVMRRLVISVLPWFLLICTLIWDPLNAIGWIFGD